MKKLIFGLFGAFLIGQKFILALKWSATVINCNTTVITFILSFFITQSFCVTLEWKYNLGIKVLLWNGGNFFVDNTEFRFYLRMAVNYRSNLFVNTGSWCKLLLWVKCYLGWSVQFQKWNLIQRCTSLFHCTIFW
jgi:hypothetical protein